MEEREKVVRHMWGVYTQSKSTRLPRFWLEAFEAAYEHLASDVQGVRDAAVSEIAKMSMRSLRLDPLPTHSKVTSSSFKGFHFLLQFSLLLSQLGFLLLVLFFTFKGGRETEQTLVSADRILPKLTNLDSN